MGTAGNGLSAPAAPQRDGAAELPSSTQRLNTEMTNAGILYFGNQREQAEHTQPRATKEMGGNGPPDHLVETG